MNCKPGDLAIIVKTSKKRSEHIGKIMRCVRLVDVGFSGWIVEPELKNKDGSTVLFAEDEALKSIRGDLLDDETTTSKELEAV